MPVRVVADPVGLLLSPLAKASWQMAVKFTLLLVMEPQQVVQFV
jgi:hypothetical protein